MNISLDEPARNPSEKEMSRIINSYGYGLTTWKIYTLVMFILSLEGFHFTFFGNMIIPLKQFYGMEDSHVQIINGLFFLSVGLGSVSTGYLSDWFKRVRIISVMVFLIAVCHIVLGFITNIFLFAVVRCLLALFHGIAIPISLNLLTEYLPVRFRSVMITGVWMGFIFGQLLNLVLILVIMPNYETDRYQETIVYSSILSVFTFVIVIIFLEDSPRNLISSGDNAKAFKILERLNGSELTEKQKESIIYEANSGANKELNASITEVFNPSLRRISILLTMIWMVNSLLMYGPNLISPLTMKKLGFPSEELIVNQIIIALISSPCNVIGGFISEIPFLGRNKTCIISLIIMVLCNVMLIVNSVNYEFYIGIYFFLINIAFNVNNTYSCEVYPTKVRDLAIGFLFFCTRVGGFMSQIIFIEFNDWGIWVPYYVVAGLCSLNVILLLLLPYDTHSRELDQEDERKEPLTAKVIDRESIKVNDKESIRSINAAL
jgi:MFS family permease